MRRLLIGCFFYLLLQSPSPAASDQEPQPLDRTWEAAEVFLPDAASEEGYRSIATRELEAALLRRGRPLPAVVYAHGCAGLGRASDGTGAFLARAGYLVVAPDSFARDGRPKSCEPGGRRGGLYRGVLRWRQAEVGRALAEPRRLPNVDAVFLMGFSEGGITAATFRGQPLSGRVIEGWTCHAGWPEYRGLRAPADEPVLALVAARDPWFRAPYLQGDCGAFMAGRSGSRSEVIDDPPMLGVSHWLSKDAAVQLRILAFLAANGGAVPRIVPR